MLLFSRALPSICHGGRAPRYFPAAAAAAAGGFRFQNSSCTVSSPPTVHRTPPGFIAAVPSVPPNPTRQTPEQGFAPLPLSSFSYGHDRKSVLVRCTGLDGGRSVEVEFGDESVYRFHSAWLKDSSPNSVGPDFYRKKATDVLSIENFVVAGASIENEGGSLFLHYRLADGGSHPSSILPPSYTDTLNAKWLYSWAPYVGQQIRAPFAGAPGAPPPSLASGTGSLLDDLLDHRTPWASSDFQMKEFDAQVLRSDKEMQKEFLSHMMITGAAMITNVGPPRNLERDEIAKPLESLVFDFVGKMNQHPVRKHNCGVIRTNPSEHQGADYDMQNPLSMHCDHSLYHGTPGFLQFMYQAQGKVTSRVADGLALAEHIRIHHPDKFRLLRDVKLTYASRNVLYTKDGKPRHVSVPISESNAGSDGYPFELVHTTPILTFENGRLIKVVQSETKRGVCAVPFELYPQFMEAYRLWVSLAEDPRFVKDFHWPEHTVVVTNNWRVLHGRAVVAPGVERKMVFGYVNKWVAENRFRYLSQCAAETADPSLNPAWLCRVPNQVLSRLLSSPRLSSSQ
uniref:TauD/TfdA-like domain-containing protein n=1 Tax=Chromera velia CCMP2878 TaxID=1169474 RepID=A0A0G4I469_9ALVE|eukprot:Cvel_10851.t1-p1 / transcript=Cvel_10851.t1 / gene=Cvel_10851 / organism=Chromera_velia_CCMP2878 / gene_product=hypothetical protein / transcript_product=hypothetical protein / location=Cvel_scaffold664:42942-45647(-) / protein_length=566 / sequence_SO=supercontig / SO=protein_coding / is_pseudo=false